MNRESIEDAVRSFVSILLAGPAAPHVLKVMHFGSTARDDFDEDSDVDLLVISSDHEDVADGVADAAFRVQMETGIGVEPIVDSLDEVMPVTDYFHFVVMSQGKEVYSVGPEHLKNEARNHLVGLSEEYLESAQSAFSAGHLRLAVDAAYNAMELAVKAMILSRRSDLPSSHGGIVGAFGREFVQTGLLPAEMGRRINRALQLRNSARYKYQAVIGEQDAKRVLDLAAEILEASRKSWPAS